jgi:CHAT domain-containing protein/Tfp pilus assembly protein PilF
MSDPAYGEEFDVVVDEITDQYVAGEIQGEERERVENYFLKSGRRRDKVKYAAALKRYQSQHSRRRKWWESPELRIAASIILVAGVVLGLRQLLRQSPGNDGLLALQAAYNDQRPLESRLSGWNYAPLVSLRGKPKVDYVQRDRAASNLQNAVNEQRDATSLQQLGQFYLTEKQFDKAVDQFQAALVLSPQNATIHSDLGTALLEKGKTLKDSDPGKAAELFAKSLAELTKALQLDNARLEALFNRALLYSYLGLPEKAEQDWRLYIEKDPNSNWTNEAKERLKTIEEERKKTSQTPKEIFDEFTKVWNAGDRESAWKLVRDNQHRSGNAVVDRLLDDYVDRGSSDSQHASEQLPVSDVAAMYSERADDRFYSDVYESYRSASPQQIVAAKDARELMKASHALWPKNPAENLRLFTEAKQLFEKVGDVTDAMLAEYWISFCYFYQGKNEDGLKLLKPVIAECLRRNYHWLNVRCLYLRSSFESALNQQSKAIATAREACKVAEKRGDSVGLLNLVSALVEFYRFVGNFNKSFAQFERGLPTITSLPLDPIQSSRHYSFGALAFASVGFYDAAAEYQEAAMRISTRAGIEDRVVYQHAFLGAINGKRGRFDEALQNVNNAVQKATLDGQIAYSLLNKAHIYRAMGDCGKAVDNYSQSMAIYTRLKYPARIYEAHKGLLFCYISQNDTSQAEQEIATILPLIEKFRKAISEENNRNTFFETEQNVYDAVIDFEVSQLNNPQKAFQSLQNSRARSLLDLLNRDAEAVDDPVDPEIIAHSVAQPESGEEIKEKLPEGAQLVQYAVLEDKTLIWVISKREIELKQSNVSRRALNETIQRYLSVISKPSNDREEDIALAKQLYTFLIQPIESLLDNKRIICIIPDKTLSYIPFSALISPASQKYLIEDYVVTTSESPSVFLSCSRNATQKAQVKDERVLSIGNPRFDRAAFPDLEDLPNAKQEAEEIASSYKDGHPLLEANATAAVVKSEMPRADVVHLAMHSVLDSDVPLNSSLLFASSGTQSKLHAYEIYRLGLDRTRLVVLSACQTGAERYYDGEGMASLARAFIGAGVPMVVASLWPVDSAATEKLMVRFHKERRQTSTAVALANAQRAMLHDSQTRFQSPYYWAAFNLNGGYAEF